MNTMAPTTDALLNRVAADWARLGVFFAVERTTQPVELEEVICRTASLTRDDERVFICAVSWLATHHAFVNGRRLSALVPDLTREASAVLGALLTLATQGANGHAPELDAAIARCRPIHPGQPLFRIMDQFPSLRRRVEAQALPMFKAWGFWHDDMTLKLSVIRPVEWLIWRVPELRFRSLLGPSVEADIVAMVRGTSGRGVIARDITLASRVSYAAAHAAVTRLVQRGILIRTRRGVRQELSLAPLVAGWFNAMDHAPRLGASAA